MGALVGGEGEGLELLQPIDLEKRPADAVGAHVEKPQLGQAAEGLRERPLRPLRGARGALRQSQKGSRYLNPKP